MNDRKDKSPRRRPDISRTYAHEEARGLVFFENAACGPSFKVVAPDRTTYSGFIDLYHICESSELKCNVSFRQRCVVEVETGRRRVISGS